MHPSRLFSTLRLSLGLAGAASILGVASRAVPVPVPVPLAERSVSNTTGSSCDRTCLTNMVSLILDSMVAHDPYTLPVAPNYKATENSHPAALGMMTAWRTITKAGRPSILAADTTLGTAYFALDVSEGNDEVPNVLRGRVQVVDQHITELELFINRYRGDHGFSFSAAELPSNARVVMEPPANRTRASRDTLAQLSEALFATSSNLSVALADSCQFTELGWSVVDPGANSTGSLTPLGCTWPAAHPTDDQARTSLVIDEEYGLVVTGAIIPGIVFPYSNISAFIPDTMTEAQEAQWLWMEQMTTLGVLPMLTPMAATGDVLEVLQYYNDELQAMQINLYLGGPNMTSPWLG